jgi:ketosteroid isomerase-like protein
MKSATFGLLLSLFLFACNHPAKLNLESDRQKVLRIFESIDKQVDGFDEHWAAVADDIVYQAPGRPTIEGKEAYKKQAIEFFTGGSLEIRHELVTLESYSDVVVVRGRASGRFQPPGGTIIHPWKTRNLFVFQRLSTGRLQISQIIVTTEPE